MHKENLQTINHNTDLFDALGPVVSNIFGDQYLYSINRDAFNKVGSDAFFASHFGKGLIKKNTLQIIIGTDSGLLIRYINKQDIPEGSQFLFIETGEVLSYLNQNLDWSGLDPRIKCISYNNWFEQTKPLNITDYIYINNLKITKSVSAQDDFLSQYTEIFWQVRKKLEQLFWQVNANLGSEAFLHRQIENLAENRVPSACLKNTFCGKTAVLLAGGPSLDDFLPWVKANRDKITLLAVSRISRRLLEVNLKPDMVFSIDPHEISFDVSKEMLLLPEDTIFVNLYHASSLLVGQWHGRNVFSGQRFPWPTKLNEKSIGKSGGTVTNFALSTAIDMGFSQIVLIGLNLCYSKEGYTHAKGSNEFDTGPNLGNLVTTVETNGGWMAETDHEFEAAVNFLKLQAKEAKKNNVKLINPAPDAVKIADIDYLPVSEISIYSLDKPALTTLHDSLPEDSPEIRTLYYKNILAELARANGNFRKIKHLAIEALAANKGLFGRDGKKADFKYKKQMDKIEKKLNQQHKDFSIIVKRFGIRFFLKTTRPDPEKDWTDEEIENTAKIYYEAYRDSAETLLKTIESAQKRLQARIEEEKDSPNFLNLLIPLWKKEKQPGRALVWQARNKDSNERLSDDMKIEFELLQNDFLEDIYKKETQQLELCKQFAELTGIKNKALHFFQNNDSENLNRMIEALTKHPSKEAEPYLYLVSGYFAELRGEKEKALEHYQQLISNLESPLLEEALRRITSITLSINDGHNALEGLKCLSTISPIYLQQYAELLKISGNSQKALEAYADYIELFPEDLNAYLRVGSIYKELDMGEGAQMMFQHVLNKDPKNQAAQTLLSEME